MFLESLTRIFNESLWTAIWQGVTSNAAYDMLKVIVAQNKRGLSLIERFTKVNLLTGKRFTEEGLSLIETNQTLGMARLTAAYQRLEDALSFAQTSSSKKSKDDSALILIYLTLIYSIIPNHILIAKIRWKSVKPELESLMEQYGKIVSENSLRAFEDRRKYEDERLTGVADFVVASSIDSYEIFQEKANLFSEKRKNIKNFIETIDTLLLENSEH